MSFVCEGSDKYCFRLCFHAHLNICSPRLRTTSFMFFILVFYLLPTKPVCVTTTIILYMESTLITKKTSLTTFDELEVQNSKFHSPQEAKHQFPVCVTFHRQLRITADNDQVNKLLLVFILIL